MLSKWCTFALFLVGPSIVGGQTPQDERSQKTIAVFGSTLRYTETGSGPTVVLLHGLGGDATNWAATVPILATQFHVIALDQIGFGRSDKPHVPYRVGTLVDFLHGFLLEKGIARASLVGNSLGGWTAAYFTLAHPEMVDRLVLANAAGVSPELWRGDPWTIEWLSQLNPSTLAGTREFLSFLLYDKSRVTDQLVELAFEGRLANDAGYTIEKLFDSFLRNEDPLDARVGGIRTSTLVLWGREDRVTPLASGEALVRLIPAAKRVVIDNCGHVPQIECAEPFNAAVMQFLTSASP
jgi:triacylglycerol lipase